MQIAIALRFDNDRATLFFDDPAGITHRLMNGNNIHSITFNAGKAEHRTTRRNTGFARGVLNVGRYSVEIVLNVENDRQTVECGDVHRFISGPLQGSTIAKESDRYTFPAKKLVRKCVTGGMRNISADNRARSRNA